MLLGLHSLCCAVGICSVESKRVLLWVVVFIYGIKIYNRDYVLGIWLLGCSWLGVMGWCCFGEMVEEINSVIEFVLLAAYLGGLLSKFSQFIWGYYDELVCWCPDLVKSERVWYVYPFAGKGNPHKYSIHPLDNAKMPLRQR